MQQPADRSKPAVRTMRVLLWPVFLMLALVSNADVAQSPGIGTLELRGVNEAAIRLATDVDVRVTGHLARTRMTQRFRNPTDQWVSATYLLPLPNGAAVDTLELLIDETRVVGEIRTKKVAEQTFRDAEQRGQRAALVSGARPNLFNTAVSNIPPDGEVVVTIEYQETVQRNRDRYSLRLPLTLTPRFNPGEIINTSADRLGNGWAPATDRVPDAPRITPAMLLGTPEDTHRLTLRVQLSMGTALSEILSDYHWIDVTEGTAGDYLVSLANDNEPLDHDFSLSWRPQTGDAVALTAFQHRGDDLANYLSMQLLPPSGAIGEAPPRELIIVIDTSGSMQGVSIEQARSAVQYAISELRDVDRFNVIAFSDQASPVFPVAQPATLEAQRQALRWVNSLEANGGTNMQPALEAALIDGRQAASELRQVIFVTDGAVGDESHLFKFIQKSLGNSRLFTVGIGSAPNGWFMRKAAELGRGDAVTISALGEVELRMRELFGRLGAPTLTDLRAEWPIDGVEQIPAMLPDLYAGEPIDIVARSAQTPASLRVSGTLWRDGVPEPWESQLLVSDAASGGRGVAVAWANQKIDALIDEERRGQRSRSETDAIITEVALAHHVVSRTTSLVAVAAAPVRPANQSLKQSAVPNLMPYGQGLPVGQIVATATPAPLQRLIGFCVIALALLVLLISRWQALYAPARQ
ncbi:MAG: marine proteobacterial sortase target protein [Pseudomonadota bacterium]